MMAEQTAASVEVQDPTNDDNTEKRKRPGRAARRRRRKVLDIQEAEKRIREGGSSANAEQELVVPKDRSAVWAGVLDRRNFHKWSAQDEAGLVGQLGYLPGNVINVATRTEDLSVLKREDGNLPVVVQLYPIVFRQEHDGGKAGGRTFKARKRQRQVDESSVCDDDTNALIEPFPTMFWLTHPLLRILVSKLEVEGLGTKLEKRLTSETDSLEAMRKAHSAYGAERYRLLTEEDDKLVRTRKWEFALNESRGVAGIRNFAAVKCLHAHAAHFLSGCDGSSNNVVGKWVMDEIQDQSFTPVVKGDESRK